MRKGSVRSPVARIIVVTLLVSAMSSALGATLAGAEDAPTFITKWGTSGSHSGQFNYPNSVTADGNGNVFVSDHSNDRVQKFTSTGTFIMAWGSHGSGEGQFDQPGGIAVDTTGNVYVSDSGNSRVEKFSPTGTFITEWGSYGTGDGQFHYTGDIAVDDANNVYVVDIGEERVEKFTSTGAFITKWGSYGTHPGEFQNLGGIAVDGNGDIYVVDSGYMFGGGDPTGVQKFNSTGAYITGWGTFGSGDGQFDHPADIAVDQASNVYVTDTSNHRIEKFTSTGTLITTWGNNGSGDGQFNNPIAISVDAHGNVYVADSGNNRIQKFGSPSSQRYVALGDSYSSGEGVPAFQTGTDTAGPPENRCHRSYGAYPRLLEQIPDPPGVAEHWACSGATINNVRIQGQWNEAPQLDRLSPDVGLVTVSIGGNDAGFGQVLADCVYSTVDGIPVPIAPGREGCRNRRRTSQPRQIAKLASGRAGDPRVPPLHELYEEIHTRAPQARILVVGYPRLFPAVPMRACRVGTAVGRVKLKISAADMEWMNAMSNLMARTIKNEVAIAAGHGVDIDYVDVRAAFAGHEVCSTSPWINGVPIDYWQAPNNYLPTRRPWSFHPNQHGQAAYAAAVAELL